MAHDKSPPTMAPTSRDGALGIALRAGRLVCAAGLLMLVCATVIRGAEEYHPVRHPPASASQGSGAQRIIVKFRATSTSSRNAAQAAADPVPALALRTALTLKQSRRIAGQLHVMHVEPAAGQSITATLEELRADAAVEYAEVDQRRYPHAVPNDPLYAGQWFLQNDSATPSAIDAVSAWDVTMGRSDTVIADLDTGVVFDHPDLKRATASGRLLPGYDFVSDTEVANDGDGRDADAADPGDWISTADANTTTFSDCAVSDSSWHGTRVAGILGALTNNATGVAGVTWSGSILPVRVLGKCGGYDSDILAAMLWAAGISIDGVPDNAHPAHIENLSLGATGTSCPATYRDVVRQLAERGVLVVVSAGNEGGPVDIPANCSGVAAIAGLRHVGTKVGFSSLGSEIAVSAPGGNCVNTASGDPCLYSLDTTVNLGTTGPEAHGYTDQFNTNIGTSFSAPIVSGIAALMVAMNGHLSPTQLIARLKSGSTAFPVSSDTTLAACHVPTSANDLQTAECQCTTQTCGAGMANANGAVQEALRPIAIITPPASITAGENVVLQGQASTAARNATLSAYTWTILDDAAILIQNGNTDTATVVAPWSGSYTVRLTVMDTAGREDSAELVVSATGITTPSTVTVSPESATVQAGIGTQAFTATVANATDVSVTWQVEGVTGGDTTVGTISTSGVYRAPESVPSSSTVTVTAVGVEDSSQSASAQVTITEPVAVSIAPSSASVKADGGTQPFTATITNSSNTAVTWQVNGMTGGDATVGTISTSGLYAAPASVPSPSTVSVTAVSAADPNRTASAQVTIAAASSGGGGALDGLSVLLILLSAGMRLGSRLTIPHTL